MSESPEHVVYESETTRIERVEEDGKSMVAKILTDIRCLSSLYNEFNILTKMLDKCDSARSAIRKGRIKGNLTTYLEWAEGFSLKEWIQQHPAPISYDTHRQELIDRAKIAKAIVAAVSQIHENGVAHNDLVLENIIIDIVDLDKDLLVVKIIDFGHAQAINAAEISDDGIQVNDDFFHLGSMLHAIFIDDVSGTHEAFASDFMTLNVSSKRDVPQSIVNLIDNLMHGPAAPLPYTSTKDTELDLQQMLDLPERFLFHRNEKDKIDSLQFLPGKLYGRDKELTVLADSYRRMCILGGSPEMILVSGDSGTGKTSLVRHFLAGKDNSMRGYFVSGKFDQLCRSQPDTALIVAFQELCDCILEKDQIEIDGIRSAIMEAVGDQGGVLTNFIPKLTKIIGKQPKVNEASGLEAQNRLMFVLRMFVRSISTSSNPVVIFLDDLQWADSASLDLIRTLVTDSENESFAFIGCYRAKEVTKMHPFSVALREIEGRNGKITEIKVGNLALQTTNRFIADALYTQQRTVKSLSTALYEKTSGNIFFLIHFLLSLVDEKLLFFDPNENRWTWDEDGVNSKHVSEKVGELLASKIMKLSTGAQEVLQLAAAIGSYFEKSIMLLVAMGGKSDLFLEEDKASNELTSEMEIHEYLNEAVENGLVMPMRIEGTYKFAHDRIQQAAYHTLSVETRRRLHLNIGSTIVNNSTTPELERLLFFVVDQLNEGSQLITGEERKMKFVRLNQQAAQKAVKSSAYVPASIYLQTAIKFLSPDHWDNAYHLSLELLTSLAEALYCTGNLDQVEEIVKDIFLHAHSFADKLRAHMCLMKCLVGKGKLQKAIDVGFDGLAQVGEDFPKSVNRIQMAKELYKTKYLLAGKSNNFLSTRPQMKNQDKIAAMKIMSDLGPISYLVQPMYSVLLAFRMVRLSLKFGSCNEAVNGYAAYAGTLVWFGDYKSGSRFCQLALTLVDTLNAKEWVARVNCDIYISSKHWVTHLKNTIEPMKDAHRMAMENGDVGYAGYLACFVCTHSFLMGANLIPLEHDMQSFTDEMVQYSTEASRSTLIVFHQSVLNLLGRSADPIRLTGELMDEDAHIALMKEESNALAETTIYMNDILLSYWFGDYDRAGEFVDKIKRESIKECHCFCVYVFFTGLTCFVLAKRSNPKKWVNLGNKSIKKMQKWALHSPSNCLQKLLLLKAEKAVFWGYQKKAIENFKEAIMFAQKHGFLHEEALANERLGLFLVDIEKHELGCKQLARAMELYQKWGAQAKYLHVKEQLITLSHAM